MGYKDQYTLGQVASLEDKRYMVLMHRKRRNHQAKHATVGLNGVVCVVG